MITICSITVQLWCSFQRSRAGTPWEERAGDSSPHHTAHIFLWDICSPLKSSSKWKLRAFVCPGWCCGSPAWKVCSGRVLVCGLPDDSCTALPARIAVSKTASLLSRATVHRCDYIKTGVGQDGHQAALWRTLPAASSVQISHAESRRSRLAQTGEASA